jgi:hypothetical protein
MFRFSGCGDCEVGVIHVMVDTNVKISLVRSLKLNGL